MSREARHKPSPSDEALSRELSVPTDRTKTAEMAGPYILGKTLGRGTSGKVKEGWHKDTGLEVAVKIVKKDYVKAHKQKIAREIAVMRLLEHPHIMKLYDVFETRQHYFMVLERVKGGELFDYIIQKGRLPRKEALRIISQCIQGLEYCHMHSICHRDLKPENLLLDENFNIKMADFGMAQIIPDGGVLGTFCGSPHYGAPEVVSGIKYDGRKSDVWSLGVVFYALVTAMLPFDHKNIPDLLKLVKKGQYTIPAFVEPDIRDLLKRLLTFDIDKRIRTPQIKFHPVFMGKNNINLYFPATAMASPALEYMKAHPVLNAADLDQELIRDMDGLGWGTPEELQSKLLLKRDASLHNLELVFYCMLAARNVTRVKENRVLARKSLMVATGGAVAVEAEADTGTPAVSFRSPPPTPTDERARDEAYRASHGRAGGDESAEKKFHKWSHAAEKKADAAPAAASAHPVVVVQDSADQAKVRKAKPPTIDTAGAAAAAAPGPGGADPQYVTTPRFHRLKLTDAEPDTPVNQPTTPSAKRSWFKDLFKRRPSVDIVSKDHQQKGASGMYSPLRPDEIRVEVERVLTLMGIDRKIGSSSDYELKGSCMAHLDDKYRIVVLDKAGKEVKYRDSEEPEAKGEGVGGAGEETQKSGGSDPFKMQLVKFSVEISREPNDKVSCVNFNHRSGNLMVYRGLYTEIIKNLNLGG